MSKTHRRTRRARSLTSGLALALALISGAVVVAVTGAQPASAATVTRPDADTIVITSNRLSDNTARATLTLTLRSNGDEFFHADVHVGGLNRKYLTFSGTWSSAAAPVGWTGALTCEYVNSDTYWSGGTSTHDPELARQWGTISSNSLSYHFNLDSARTVNGC